MKLAPSERFSPQMPPISTDRSVREEAVFIRQWELIATSPGTGEL